MAANASMIERVKELTGTYASTGDAAVDAVVENNIAYIVEAAENALLVLLGNPVSLPDNLSYIVVDVACARFNRISSEGAASHDLGGERMTFEADDFLRYMSVINAYKANEAGGSVKIKFW